VRDNMKTMVFVSSSFFIILLLLYSCVQEKIGLFENSTDIGSIKLSGSVKFNSSKQQYSITGSGANMWDTVDAFHFVWRKASGDLNLSTKVIWIGKGQHYHRKAGLLVRQSLEPDAAYVDVVVHGDGLVSMQYREQKGAVTQQIKSPDKGFPYIQLKRNDNLFTFSVANESGKFKPVGSIKLSLSDPVYVGLAVCSHDSTTRETALFSDVQFNNLP
jgi:TolB protein